MIRMNIRHMRLRMCLTFVFCIMAVGKAQKALAQTTDSVITMLTYNCENAFDTIHDEGKNDYEFLNDGTTKAKWTAARMRKKMHNIAQVIVAAQPETPFDVVTLCEVENDSVLSFLTKRTGLKHLGYRYVVTDSDDPRGVDVALMYNPLRFRPVEIDTLRARTLRATRDVLHVGGIVPCGDTLDVYVVHLPSKLGATIARLDRKRISNMVLEHADSIRCCRWAPHLVVTGDFNDELTSAGSPFTGSFLSDLIPNSTATKKGGVGTYKYAGVWGVIDHVLVYPRTEGSWSEVVQLPFLLEPDKTYGGVKPYRTFLGPAYNGGFSDHLPVRTVLRF